MSVHYFLAYRSSGIMSNNNLIVDQRLISSAEHPNNNSNIQQLNSTSPSPKSHGIGIGKWIKDRTVARLRQYNESIGGGNDVIRNTISALINNNLSTSALAWEQFKAIFVLIYAACASHKSQSTSNSSISSQETQNNSQDISAEESMDTVSSDSDLQEEDQNVSVNRSINISESEEFELEQNAATFYSKFDKVSDNTKAIFGQSMFARGANRSGMDEYALNYANGALNAAIIVDKFQGISDSGVQEIVLEHLPQKTKDTIGNYYNRHTVGMIDDATFEECNGYLNSAIFYCQFNELDESVRNSVQGKLSGDALSIVKDEKVFDNFDDNQLQAATQVVHNTLSEFQENARKIASKFREIAGGNVWLKRELAKKPEDQDILRILEDIINNPEGEVLSDAEYLEVNNRLNSLSIQHRISGLHETVQEAIKKPFMRYGSTFPTRIGDADFNQVNDMLKKDAPMASQFYTRFSQLPQEVQEFARGSSPYMQQTLQDIEDKGTISEDQYKQSTEILNAISLRWEFDHLSPNSFEPLLQRRSNRQYTNDELRSIQERIKSNLRKEISENAQTGTDSIIAEKLLNTISNPISVGLSNDEFEPVKIKLRQLRTSAEEAVLREQKAEDKKPLNRVKNAVSNVISTLSKKSDPSSKSTSTGKVFRNPSSKREKTPETKPNSNLPFGDFGKF